MRFILVDEILALTPGVSVHAVKRVDASEDFFSDHFPGFPVVPGVLLTEMMAQTAGKCLDAEQPERGKAMLVKIEQASFRAWVRPDATAHIHAIIKSSRDRVATAACHVQVGNERVCSARLLFGFVPMSSFAPDYRDEILQAFLDKSR